MRVAGLHSPNRVLLSHLLQAVIAPICVSAGLAFAGDADFHYLAADPSLRAQMQNVSVYMGQATYVGNVLKLDQPWESPFKLMYPGSVVIDPGTGQWRMYYEVMKTEEERFVALATSTDGVHWSKPALNVSGTKYTTDPRNNFINHDTQTWINSPSVFVDTSAPADQRYRMAERVNHTLYADASADGLNWRRVGTIYDGGNTGLDSQNGAFWDPRTQQYVADMRWWYPADGTSPRRRGVFIRQSSTWDTTWTSAPQYTLDPKDAIGPGPNQPDLYTPGILPYHGQYIGLPAMFYHPNGGNGAIYPTFMYSRDGASWHFDDASHPVIDLAAHGQNQDTFGMAFPSTSLIERDGELYIYYSYFAEQHDQARCSGQMCLAKLKEDRFVGIRSNPGSTGTWTTSPIVLSADPGHLGVNALVDGSFRVEVLDPSTMLAIDGYGLTDANPVSSGDFLDAIAGWSGADNLNGLANRTVVLRFLMDDVTIYGFHFQSTPEPSTLVLAAIGSLGVAAYAWRKRRLKCPT